jgi:signal transduction histidine kinase
VDDVTAEHPSATPVLLAAAIVTAGMLTTLVVHPYAPFGGRQLVDGFTLAAFIGTAALAFIRHRDTGDPHALLVGAGFAVLSAQTFLFAGASVAADRPWSPAWENRPVPSLGWMWAWTLAAVCFLLAIPWWERRGRAPLRVGVVLALAAAALAAGDLLLALTRARFAAVEGAAFTAGEPFGRTTWLHWTLGITAAVLLGVAGHRERVAARGRDTDHAWLGAAWIVAVGALVLYLAWPVQFRPLLIPGAILPPIAAGLVFTGFLVSERAEISRMRRATDRAQEITGGRAEIASTIAHELRGPVATVKGLATTGARHADTLSDAEKTEFFELIDQESRRLLRIVDETSIALKVDAGTISYDVRPENLAVVVTEGADRAGHQGHPLTVEAEPGVLVPLDRMWMTQTVTQIVENAANFSPAGAPILVRARGEGSVGVIEVLDGGPGIAAEDRERAFERFAHLRPKGYEQVPGTGLGLFICRAHVLAHGGTISIEGRAEGGTMLRIDLPMEGNA